MMPSLPILLLIDNICRNACFLSLLRRLDVLQILLPMPRAPVDGFACNARRKWAAANPSYAHYADYGQGFLSSEPVSGRYEVKEALMPDSLHPSAVGMRIIASQLEPLITELVNAPASVSTARIAEATLTRS